MQSSLAVVGFVLGGWAWWQSSEPLWIVGAILMHRAFVKRLTK
jgi:hypothetical protein